MLLRRSVLFDAARSVAARRLAGGAALLLLPMWEQSGAARAQTTPSQTGTTQTGPTQTAPTRTTPAQAPGAAAAPATSSEENLTVRGRRPRFEAAPVPGAPLGPPPETPGEHEAHLGRYKISGDQEKKDGYDTQTGAYIAPFGSAYTQAGPVADGLASHFQH